MSGTRQTAATMLALAGAAWPSAHCALAWLTATPLQRLMADAWCGRGPDAVAFLGHTPACWAGAAALMAAAMLVGAMPGAAPRRR